ncbi:MAG: TolC family protein [Terriglobia bacterium]
MTSRSGFPLTRGACLCLVYVLCLTGTASMCAAQMQATPRPVSLIEALQATLQNNTTLRQANAGILVTQSAVKRESGAFDTHLDLAGKQIHSYFPLTNYEHSIALSAGVNTYNQDLISTDLNAQGSKLLTSGIRISSQLDMSHASDNLENIGGVDITNLNVEALFPLLGGRGKRVNTQPVRIARLELEGATADLDGATASMVMKAAELYFNLVTSRQRLDTDRAAEEDAVHLEKNVDELIQADKLPAVDRWTAQASVEQCKVRVLTEEQAGIEARQALGEVMGLGALESDALEPDSDRLPTPETGKLPSIDLPSLIAQSLQLRGESQGAQKHLDAADATLQMAGDALHRRLDLAIDSGYTGMGLGEGAGNFLDSVSGRVGGANVQASLTYHFDGARSAAQAQLETAQADVTQATAQEESTNRQIAGEVVTAVRNLQLNIEMVSSAASAEDALEQTLEGERDRLTEGVAVLNDVLLAQQNLLESQLATIEARHKFALAIVQYRYATGTLFGGDASHPVLDPATFYSFNPIAGSSLRSTP